MPFPVNFETKVKEAKAINGNGYPYSIKAEDLMKNLVHAKLVVDETVHPSGLQLVESDIWGEDGYQGRMIELDGTVSGLPDGTSGDILRHDGTEWVTVATEEQVISICVDGTPTEITILKLV
jgi:hypothetical protein